MQYPTHSTLYSSVIIIRHACTVKKVRDFPSPAGMSLTKLSMAGINSIIPGQRGLVSDIQAGNGKNDNLFYSAYSPVQLSNNICPPGAISLPQLVIKSVIIDVLLCREGFLFLPCNN